MYEYYVCLAVCVCAMIINLVYHSVCVYVTKSISDDIKSIVICSSICVCVCALEFGLTLGYVYAI